MVPWKSAGASRAEGTSAVHSSTGQNKTCKSAWHVKHAGSALVDEALDLRYSKVPRDGQNSASQTLVLHDQAFTTSLTVFQSKMQTSGQAEPLHIKQWHRASLGNHVLLFGGEKTGRGDHLLLSPVGAMETSTSTNAARDITRRKTPHLLQS